MILQMYPKYSNMTQKKGYYMIYYGVMQPKCGWIVDSN